MILLSEGKKAADWLKGFALRGRTVRSPGKTDAVVRKQQNGYTFKLKPTKC